MSDILDESAITELQRRLLNWWAVHGRDLPWRASRDPWAVLVSEAMLQQTQVARVVDRWERFLDRFPTVTACAAARRGDVVDEWSGLGYNRRAVSLHRAAQECVERFDGALPTHLDDLQSLPGIGPYTARAVLVFAHEADIGLVDTNAGRFVARALAGGPVTPKVAQVAADAAVPSSAGWSWGQAVFDLGATVCTKRSPRCVECPIVDQCAWATAGHPLPDPVEGSAGISGPQSRFEGSDRQGRGRLVAALREGTVSDDELASVMGWAGEDDRARRVASSLVRDGLVVHELGRWDLPG
ncbi:A/G-specific adenine glycosylase [Actinospongicola halichondriae]|uniref:A/G-specific adenine glycosylase n=1 Tax=Actinospongicola halichondriae TaxID=3236844 RepID=UPI003D4CA5E4